MLACFLSLSLRCFQGFVDRESFSGDTQLFVSGAPCKDNDNVIEGALVEDTHNVVEKDQPGEEDDSNCHFNACQP